MAMIACDLDFTRQCMKLIEFAFALATSSCHVLFPMRISRLNSLLQAFNCSLLLRTGLLEGAYDLRVFGTQHECRFATLVAKIDLRTTSEQILDRWELVVS